MSSLKSPDPPPSSQSGKPGGGLRELHSLYFNRTILMLVGIVALFQVLFGLWIALRTEGHGTVVRKLNRSGSSQPTGPGQGLWVITDDGIPVAFPPGGLWQKIKPGDRIDKTRGSLVYIINKQHMNALPWILKSAFLDILIVWGGLPLLLFLIKRFIRKESS